MDHSKLSAVPLPVACTVLTRTTTIVLLVTTTITIMEAHLQKLNHDFHSNLILSQGTAKENDLKITSNEVWRKQKSVKNVALSFKPISMQYKELMILGSIVDQTQYLSVV